jgi:NAD(P)-dependent dehydrogenase (short-subunit alcohol dehydrogenase family)
VVGLNPGLTNTERVAEGLRADATVRGTSEQDALQQSLSRIPLGRIAEPEEIANAVAFLASAKASHITGVNISMDGAQTPVVL